MTADSCPLCTSPAVAPFAHAHARTYLRCTVCDLTFLHPADLPTPEQALAHYQTHENDPADSRYRAFLARLADPLTARLTPGARGLDFGSGPGPALSLMLEERGFGMSLYDPLFAPDEEALTRTYDFVTCTEVAEHFIHPAVELLRIDRMVVPGGWIGVMTEILEPDQGFGGWRYARDPTHSCFYSRVTLAWIAKHLGWSLAYPDGNRNVALFRKEAGGQLSPRLDDS